MSRTSIASGSDCFLICGLGSLGQHCVALLKEFGVTVIAIEQVQILSWEVPELPDLLDRLLIGDCRQPKLLEQANVQNCRTILLVTDNEQVNLEAAFAARSLNPQIRLVVRSAQQNLNQLLGQHLGNFIAFEATQLPAAAFALAALGSETLGFFDLDHQVLRVVKAEIQPDHRWCDRRQLHEINNATRRVLSYSTVATPSDRFYQWEPDTRVRAGDQVVYIEAIDGLPVDVPTAAKGRSATDGSWQKFWRSITEAGLQQRLSQFWQHTNEHRTQRVAVLAAITVLVLLAIGTLLFLIFYPGITLRDAFFDTAILLLGGYGDLFGQVQLSLPLPWGLQLFSFALTLAGTAFVGVLYALLTESLLTAKFQLLKRRPPVPEQDHVVLVGLGRVGRRVAALLQNLKQPLVGIHNVDLEAGVLPNLPLAVGNVTNLLERVNLAEAKSLVAVTDDEVKNLEIALMARVINPTANLVIRVYNQRFSENIAQLLPYAKVLGAYALAAEAFVAAAFGENILSLFRLDNQTILVTEYQVEAQDSLSGLLLAELAYGYDMVPILYQKANREPSKLMPSDDTRLQTGDRLIVLATIESLQRVERSIRAPQDWRVRVEKVVSQEAAFEGASAIARISGCDMAVARTLMNQLPGTLPVPLYQHQAQRLVRALSKVQVTAHIQQI